MLPKINENLFIQAVSRLDAQPDHEYKSRIAGVNRSTIEIEIPIDTRNGRLVRLEVHDRLNVYYMNAEGVKHLFETEVLGYKLDAIRLVVLRTPEPSAIRQIQRRNFLRVSADLEISVKLAAGGYQFLTTTDDIGGGGISFLCPEHVSVQTQDGLECWLLLNFRNGQVDQAFFKGTVVRVKELDNHRTAVMVSFQNIAEAERQKIIRYCFERQLELRK